MARPGPTGHKIRKVAWGYTLQLGGKQERKFSGEWTRDDVQNALAARLLERDTPPAAAIPKTLSQVGQEYLDAVSAPIAVSAPSRAFSLARICSSCRIERFPFPRAGW